MQLCLWYRYLHLINVHFMGTSGLQTISLKKYKTKLKKKTCTRQTAQSEETPTARTVKHFVTFTLIFSANIKGVHKISFFT